MKFLDILKTASGNMLQSKLRTFLTVIAVFVGALTLTLTNGIGSGISSYVNDQVGSLGATDVLLVQAKPETSAGAVTGSADPQKYNPDQATITSSYGGDSILALTDKDIEAIRQEPGIVSVTPQRGVAVSYVQGAGTGKYQLSVGEFIQGTNLVMVAGDRPDNSSSVLQIALPYNYPASLGYESAAAAVGKTVRIGVASLSGEISEIEATVVGVQEKSIISAGSAQVNTALNTRLFEAQNVGLPAASLNKYTFAIAHFDTSLTEAQLASLKDSLDKKRYSAQTVADRIGILKQIINGIVIVFDLFGVIALIAASFGVINTLLMAVQERTKEIGLMKAMGMGGTRIFFLFSMEAVLLGFWGSLLGVLAAIGIGGIANHYASTHFLKDFDGLHLLTFPWQSTAVIMGIIMLITFLAGTLPARRAAKLNPIDALRYE